MEQILQFDDPAGSRALRVVNAQRPDLGDFDVLYSVDAFALNRSDLLLFNDEHYSIATLPARICSEATGHVQAVGPRVTAFRPGDRVSSIPFHHADAMRYNVAGTFAVTPEPYLVSLAPSLSSEEACSVTMQYLTAFYALTDVARLCPGETLLVSAASSSAGLAAVQLGKSLGATVVGTTRNGSKRAAIEQAGADVVLVSDTQDLHAELLDFTDGAGVDVAYDPVSGSFPNRYMDGMAFGGRVVLYGTLTGSRLDLDLVKLVRRNVVLYPYSLFNFVLTEDRLERGKRFLQMNCSADGLRPVIDRVFPWSEALDAFDYLGRHEHTGKVVVAVAETV